MHLPISAHILSVVNFILLVGMCYIVYRVIKHCKRK